MKLNTRQVVVSGLLVSLTPSSGHDGNRLHPGAHPRRSRHSDAPSGWSLQEYSKDL